MTNHLARMKKLLESCLERLKHIGNNLLFILPFILLLIIIMERAAPGNRGR